MLAEMNPLGAMLLGVHARIAAGANDDAPRIRQAGCTCGTASSAAYHHSPLCEFRRAADSTLQVAS